ncbi:MAG: hypothetical protein C4289_08130 [Chloroflexota bacterium]
MAIADETGREQRVDAGQLQELVRRAFERCGMAPHDAGLLADTLVTADQRGVHSYGVLRVPEYVERLTRDGVDPVVDRSRGRQQHGDRLALRLPWSRRSRALPRRGLPR